MAERKFQVIKERVVGSLDEKLKRRWDALQKRRARLEAEEAKLATALDTFSKVVGRGVSIPESEHDAFRGLRVDATGLVFATFCECPTCQAELHGMTVAQVVEEMIKLNIVDPNAIETLRRQAAETLRAPLVKTLLN
jgi:hypothetical protein